MHHHLNPSDHEDLAAALTELLAKHRATKSKAQTRRRNVDGTPCYTGENRSDGRAVVTLSVLRRGRRERRTYKLGRYGSPESYTRYAAIVKAWEDSGRTRLPGAVPRKRDLPKTPRERAERPPATLAELGRRWLEHARIYYRREDGSSTGEAEKCTRAVDLVGEMFGDVSPDSLSPKLLADFRDALAARTGRRGDSEHAPERPLARTYINDMLARVRRMFDWGAERELVDAAVAVRLHAVKRLRPGRSMARDPEPIPPAPELHVAAVIPHLRDPLKAALAAQVTSGARPGEILRLCENDLDLDGPSGCWVFEPGQHKGRHRGKRRRILLPPRAQAWLQPLLERHRGDEPMISPRDVRNGRDVDAAYDVAAYGRALRRGCELAKVPVFTGLRVRHTTATVLRRTLSSVDLVAAVLGHEWAMITERYAEIPLARAAAELVDVPWSFLPSAPGESTGVSGDEKARSEAAG